MDSAAPRPSRLDPLLRAVAEGFRRAAFADVFGRAALWVGGALAAGVLLSRSVAGWDPLAALGSLWVAGETGGAGAGGALALAAATVLIAAGFAAWRTRRAGLDDAAAALWLDLRAGSGGEVVTADELGGPGRVDSGSVDSGSVDSGWAEWRERAANLAASVEARPEVRWGPAVACAVGAVAAVLMTQLVPLRSQLAPPGNGLPDIFEERIEELDEKLAALDEEVGLEESEREEIEEALERLEASLDEEPDLEATYEALDSLDEQLGARAEEALAEATQALSAIDEAVANSEGSDEVAEPATDPGSELAASPDTGALEDLLGELDLPGASPDLTSGMNAALEMSLAGADLADLASLAEANLAELSPEELAALAEAMKAALNGPLESLAEAGLLKNPGKFSGRFKPSAELAKLTEEQLAMLKECPDCGKEPGGT